MKRQFALEELRGLEYFQAIEWFESIDSTSKALLSRVRQQTTPLPALLIADSQSSGVGRGNHQWWSPSGCLMFSMAIPVQRQATDTAVDPTQLSTDATLLPLRVGCTIAQTLRPITKIKPRVKWPNDVFLGDRKVCGVLIETIPVGGTSQHVTVIGIGINCQVNFEQAPDELRQSATSLHDWALAASFESTSPESVLVQFVHQWLRDECAFRESQETFSANWPEHSLLDGHWVEVKHAGGIARGLCLGINQQGALRIQDEQLQIAEVLAGTVTSYRSLPF
jgi:BirA family transcriptional regulator, biotin operon repressor / biotin---[acetyl-CoA-carboxylase] ligase